MSEKHIKYVNVTPEESGEVQLLAFEQGYHWSPGDKNVYKKPHKFLFLDTKHLVLYRSSYFSENWRDDYDFITLEEAFALFGSTKSFLDI